MRICPDTSVLFPSLVRHHEDYARTSRELDWRIEQGDEFVFAAHTLIETYSTLTRVPPRFRLSAQIAFDSVARLVAGRPVVALTAEEYLDLLRGAPARRVSGGRVYDALIAATAVKAGADAILTLNRRHCRCWCPETAANFATRT